MKFFNNIKTLEQLKKEYHKLVMKHHPDVGGKEELMKEINNEYEKLFDIVKNRHINKEGEYYDKKTNEASSEFIELINELLKLNNINIEIIGSFVWVSGDTKPHKEKLKELGLRWHKKKMCWYLSPDGYRRFGKSEYTMDDIRNMYGVQFNKSVKTKELK